jgi:hypothetical protein
MSTYSRRLVRMKVVIAIAAVVALALVGASVLGVAGAETTTTTATTPATPAVAPLRTVSVQGVATAPVEVSASATAATAVYRQAMAGAIADGQSKAQYLSEKAGATLGTVQSVAEGGGYISCPENVEYQGAQPDFGSAQGPTFAAAAGSAVAPRARHVAPAAHRTTTAKRRKRHVVAHRAAAESCTLSTQVALVYQLG